MRSFWYTSSGEKRATHLQISNGEKGSTWVGGEGGVLILVMEFKGVDTLALLVEEVSQIHF
jgi:hypothetical protein